jgi:lipopolysaccharide transport system ATP-binding protein
MSDDIVISVENVSKAYRIWEDPGARLKSPLLDGLARLLPTGSPGRNRLQAKAAAYYRDFYALKDISFQVRKGESVGIIGRNGSGKSTLLQIIAGTLQPTTGSVRVRGRVAALLELGSGFNPEFTGRENVYLNAAVLGLSRAETDAKFDSIAAFADIGDFLDQPVKTYSSGMMMRLAFAVQTAVEPDILIVDEALSVGDEAFQRKCFARLERLKERGTGLLFVSHGAAQIIELCGEAIWLNCGRIEAAGPPKTVVNLYHRALFGGTPIAARTASSDAPPTIVPDVIPWKLSAKNDCLQDSSFLGKISEDSATTHYPEAGAQITAPSILNIQGEQVNHLTRGRHYWYSYEVEIKDHLRGVRFGAAIRLVTGTELGGMTSHRSSERIAAVHPGQRFAVRFLFECHLLPGSYFFNAGALALSDNGEEYFAHRLVDAVIFRVLHESDLPVNATISFLKQADIAEITRTQNG